MQKELLSSISRQIIASSGIQDELQCADALASFLTQFSLKETDNNRGKKYTDTIVSGGIALSPSEAAICIDDYLRTVRFIKGTFNGIKELQNRFADQKINILYAGCGPFATILTPLLPLFRPEEIGLTLLDINEYSITSATSLLSALGLQEYIDHTVCSDATLYKYDPLTPLHLVVSETMYYALVREPQVAITLNLVPQLTPGGILVPEDISIDLVQTFFAKERCWKIADNTAEGSSELHTPYDHKPIIIDRLFSMNKDHLFSDTVKQYGRFETDWYPVPANFPERPDLCLFTTVTVFGDTQLHSSESFITNPYGVASIYSLNQNSNYKLTYDFKSIPTWKIESNKG
jgi:hypothetical protein